VEGNAEALTAPTEGQSCFRWWTSTIGSRVAAAKMPIWRDVGRLVSGCQPAAQEAGRSPAQGGSAYDEASGKERPISTKNVLVLGGNFAGLTAALSLKHELQDGVDVTVVSKSD
jgi:NADPH-dependent 2,4-dienoyl-CoA reductase/sulfur reductase-like enzyme